MAKLTPGRQRLLDVLSASLAGAAVVPALAEPDEQEKHELDKLA